MKSNRFQVSFEWAWDHAKTEYPHVYEAAFGKPNTDTALAATDADATAALDLVGTIANRIRTEAKTDFKFGWNFVQNNLPHIFNRQFKAQSVVTNRIKVDEGNFAGVQKRAEKYFGELVQAEQNLYNIPFSQAFMRVTNRQPVLRALANYEIAPPEAFAQTPELREKLLPKTASRENKPINDAAVQAKALRLYNRLVSEEIGHGLSQFAANRRVMEKHTILCKLLNREISPKGVLNLFPELYSKLVE